MIETYISNMFESNMLERNIIKHPIDRDIIDFLTTHEYARFSDMRPPKVDTNLFTYHLKLLVKNGYLTKTDEGYTLSEQGLSYVDRVTPGMSLLRAEPRVITALLIQDGYGKVLLQKRSAQPHIHSWELPSGEMRIDDQSVLAMAHRLANEKLSYRPATLRHVGDCYVVVGKKVRTNVHPGEGGVFIDGDVLHLATRETFETQSRTLMHVVRFEFDDITIDDRFVWAEPLDIRHMKVAPGTEQIVTRAFFGDSFFFEEFIVQL